MKQTKLVIQMAVFISMFLIGIVAFGLSLRETATIIKVRNICIVTEYEKQTQGTGTVIYDYCDAKANIEIKG